MKLKTAIFTTCIVLAGLGAGSTAQTPAPAPGDSAAARTESRSSRSCTNRNSPMTPGDIALSRDEYEKAIDLYKALSAAPGPGADAAKEALIRTMIEAGRIADAEALAKPWADSSPKSAWALTALAELQFRKAAIDDALETLKAAFALDPCNARTRYALSRLFALNGMYGSAKKFIDSAHMLDPIDDEIAGAWIASQPKANRILALTRYLDQSKFLTDKQRESTTKWLDRLKAPADEPCHLVTSVESTSMPYRVVQDGDHTSAAWVLDVTFNGKRRHLELDTGASGLVLTRNAAEGMELVPRETTTSSGFGDEGSVSTYIARVKSIKVGGLEFANCNVQVLGRTSHFNTDGLIGGDVFEHFLLTLDFPGRVLKLDPLPPLPGEVATPSTTSLATSVEDETPAPRDRYTAPGMENWTPVYRSGHFLILPVQLNSRPVRLFIIDSGSSLNLISPQAAREVTKVAAGADVQFFGISGEVKKIYTTDALTLDFAGLRQPTTGMTAIDTSKDGRYTGVDISGFLGAPTLRQLVVRIDYRDNLMSFTFDPKHQRNCMIGTNLLDCY